MKYVVLKLMPSINTANVEGVFEHAEQAQQFARLFSISDPEHTYSVHEMQCSFSGGDLTSVC